MTGKMPVSVGFASFETDLADFLIPNFNATDRGLFLGLKTGQTFPYGAVSYIGREVDAADIIDRMPLEMKSGRDVTVLSRLIDHYIDDLQQFSIGNIIRILYDGHGDFTLLKVSDRPPRAKTAKLPG